MKSILAICLLAIATTSFSADLKEVVLKKIENGEFAKLPEGNFGGNCQQTIVKTKKVLGVPVTYTETKPKVRTLKTNGDTVHDFGQTIKEVKDGLIDLVSSSTSVSLCPGQGPECALVVTKNGSFFINFNAPEFMNPIGANFTDGSSYGCVGHFQRFP